MNMKRMEAALEEAPIVGRLVDSIHPKVCKPMCGKSSTRPILMRCIVLWKFIFAVPKECRAKTVIIVEINIHLQSCAAAKKAKDAALSCDNLSDWKACQFYVHPGIALKAAICRYKLPVCTQYSEKFSGGRFRVNTQKGESSLRR